MKLTFNQSINTNKKNKIMKNAINSLILLVALVFALTSCEDDVLKDYVPRNMVEAYLIVDHPIENVKVLKSQQVFGKFDYNKALIRDAQVFVKGDGQVIELKIDQTGVTGYYDPAKQYLIKPNTEYTLEIILSDKTVMTAKTITPGKTEWTKEAKDQIQYPKDTLKLKASEMIQWKRVTGVDFYIGNIKCLDTLNYGKYLTPATEELNRRCYNFTTDHQDGEEFKEISMTVFLANNESSVVWNAFKWFGKHSVTIYAPDDNMIRWFIQSYQMREFDSRLNSINNGYGCFGSASMVTDTFFLVKNQQ